MSEPNERDLEVAWEHYDTLCNATQHAEHIRITAAYRAEIEARCGRAERFLEAMERQHARGDDGFTELANLNALLVRWRAGGDP